MKKVIIYVFLIIFFLINNICLAEAQNYNTYSRRFRTKYLETHAIELGLKLLNFTYKEPGVGVKDQGNMNGIGMVYTYHGELMLRAALDYYIGMIDYKSDSGKMNNVAQYVLELRWLIGDDIPLDNSPNFAYLTPYTGIGYRYWKDYSGGKITDLRLYGYDRETTYFYSPLGIETITKLENEWFIGIILEFDLFWKGKNKTHLSDVDPSNPDLEFDQDGGYGFKFALKMKKALDKAKIGIVPFFNYWDIDKSEEKVIYDPLNGYWIFYEPENNTREFGINITVEF